MSSLTENPERFAAGARLLVGAEPSAASEMEVISTRPHRGGLLVCFAGVADREGAERLRGRLIFAEASTLPELDDDAFWEHQLVGLEVFERGGGAIGTIARVVAREEQDLWEVETPSGRVQVPAAKQIVVSVDLEARRVEIDPPEGLFDQ